MPRPVGTSPHVLVRFQLKDAQGVFVSTAMAQIWVDGAPGTSSGGSSVGNYFTYDPNTNQ